MCLLFVSLYLVPGFGLLLVRSSSDNTGTSMAGKGKKHHQPTMDIQEGGEAVGEEKSFFEIFMAGQARRDEEMIERMEAAKRDQVAAEAAAKKERIAAEARAKKDLLAAEERAEERRLREQIAAEEREEKRMERAKIAEEARAEARALQKEKRKREEAERLEELALRRDEAARQEARRIEEVSKEREEAARLAADRLAEQHAEAAAKAHEQQRTLMELQADLGRKAAEASRLESAKLRARDRVISGLPAYHQGEDVEAFFTLVEGRLEVGDIPEVEWVGHVTGKLTGELGAKWQELSQGGGDYPSVKAAMLIGSGYTPRTAGSAFHAFRGENTKGMSGDQLYRKGVRLVQRMLAPVVVDKDVLFRLVKPWVLACVSNRCVGLLDARDINDSEALVKGLQDYLNMEGDKVAGKAAVFGSSYSGPRRAAPYHSENKKPREAGSSNGSGSSSGGGFQFNCFKCGKQGHKAADCWQGGGKSSGDKPPPAKIVCYICGVEGHKSTTCPKRDVSKDAKSIKQLSRRDPRDAVLDGKLNGAEVVLLLDSGAHITIVPEHMVGEELRTGKSVSARPYRSDFPLKFPTATVKFSVEGMEEWEEVVGLAPAEEGKECEVLYGLDLKTDRGMELAVLVNKSGQVPVMQVTTRAASRQEAQREEQDAKLVAVEKPRVKAVSTVAAAESVRKLGAGEGSAVADRPAVLPEPASSEVEEKGREESTGTGESAADRPVGNPGPATQPPPSLDEWPDLDSLEEEGLEMEEEEEQVDLPGEVEYCLRSSESGLEDLGVPPVEKGLGSRPKLVKGVKEDPTLESWRVLAERGEQGFRWERGLLYQTTTTHTGEVVHLMVLPKAFRGKVLKMAHEGSGHLGARKVKALLRQRFTWPGMGVDVMTHTRSCSVCQLCSKPKSRKAPMMERKVMTEPFEVMAFDLVGPLPKGKGGCMYILTAVCMGSRWPEAIPLKSITARAVATGMVEIFARTGIPLQLLTDQGSQFMSSLEGHLCKDLGIDRVRTAPYHPETNGVVERMHGTLKPMLRKASHLGLDWVTQLPFALFALRSAPNRDSSFSPYQLVYGHRVRTPLDILHQGWADLSFEELDTEEWSSWLVDRLEVWHSTQRERMIEAGGKRKSQFDKGTVDRQLEKGDKVLCRIPGCVGKLEESWHGPYVVEEKIGQVNYKVKVGRGKAKVLHINNLKRYFDRVEDVLRLALVAEDWSEDEVVGTRLQGSYEGFDEESVVSDLKSEFPEVFSNLPGKAKVGCFKIETGNAEPRRSHPYRVPDRLKEGVRSEVKKLVDLGIVVPSISPWASPVVPVPKNDGTVRVCIDYRKLNEVTTSDPYYMASMEEILERVGSSKIISKIDLCKGFYQVEVDPSSQEKTAFVSPYGKFEFKRMPFGLKNAPAAFQRMMEVVLGDCYEYSAPYIDDVVVYSENEVEHVQHLRCVLECFRKFGLTLKEAKCEWGKVKVEYLGHVIGGGELAVPAHRAAAMADYIQPRTKKQLRSFLGAAGYYRQFVEGFAKLSAVLTPWTAKSAPSVVGWTVEGREAFERIKVSLVNCVCLTIPSQEDTFILHTDASGMGIGATLNVRRNGKILPVAYYSRQLQGAQHRYSATELEGLAVFKAVHFFAHYLYGARFEVMTDHKALVSLLHSRVLNRRLHGWVMQLLEFDFVVKYRPGSENGDADALSRQDWESKLGSTWRHELDEEDQGLRAAQSFVVGGDVGTEPHRSNNRSAGVATTGVALQGPAEGHRSKDRRAGVATTGVALQGPAEGAQQEAGKRVATIGVALKEAVCKGGSGSVQSKRAVCKHYLPNT